MARALTAEQRAKVEQALQHIDLHDTPLSVMEAAVVAGVEEHTVRQWKARGHLVPACSDEFGRPLFLGIDVLRAEAKTHHRARRHFPQDHGLAERHESRCA